jgi:serine/threonine-protein kinase
MSPEQVFGERDIDQRSDIWALGVILYECLTGTVPTKAANVGQVFKLIVAGGIKPLGTVLPDGPEAVTHLVDRMLARRRDHRPFDLNAIARVLAGYTTIEVPAFGPPHIPGVAALGPTPNADETQRRISVTDSVIGTGDGSLGAVPRRRLGRLTTIGLGTLVVTVLIGESFLLWRTPRARLPVSSPAPPAPPAPPGAEAPRSKVPATLDGGATSTRATVPTAPPAAPARVPRNDPPHAPRSGPVAKEPVPL